jgi:CheY-like chemotaxis protein
MMPGMDGIALARCLRASHPRCAVLLFSGNAETELLLEQAKHDGQDFEVLAKPVPPRLMLARIAEMLSAA